jgi:hypothetical protein
MITATELLKMKRDLISTKNLTNKFTIIKYMYEHGFILLDDLGKEINFIESNKTYRIQFNYEFENEIFTVIKVKNIIIRRKHDIIERIELPWQE